MASGWRGKPVLVAVYVETPRKRRLITNSSQQNRQGRHLHHHHHVHHNHHVFIHRKPGNGRGYNRRTELLDYSRRLRESAKLRKRTPLLPPQPKPVDSLQWSSSQIIPVKNKLRPAIVPTCFGCLTIRLPGFSGAKRGRKENRKRGQSIKSRMESIVKSFQVQKKGRFFSRMFGTLSRNR